MKLPKFVQVHQRFEAPVVEDIGITTEAEVARMIDQAGMSSGASVAVAAGSRGIMHIATIIKHTVDALHNEGMKPFIVPAMGSHGGATSDGQLRVLNNYGISEATMSCPIRSDIEPELIGETGDGLPVYIDRNALSADHIVIVNRIKPHTDFAGDIGSGLMKMMAIGLGKQKGASFYHGSVFEYGFEHMITTVSAVVMKKTPVAFGLAIIENAYDQTAHIVGVPVDGLEQKERELFQLANRLMPRLPFEDIDVLIVDEMGKNIGGTGMDTNIIGRRMQDFEPEPVSPQILRIVVRGLTPESEGNAVGVGLADFTTQRLVNQINHHYTYINSITGMGPQKARIPVYFDTDREVIEAAFSTIGMKAPESGRAVRIKNTLHLGEVAISETLMDEIADRDDLEVSASLSPLPFDHSGTLVALS
ncbi:MAG: lactate racemase domain-containing protein [Gemmatimonadota bacterium]|nr:lactate racemase domain-containing protein [Gemmatimonadota bacterium]